MKEKLRAAEIKEATPSVMSLIFQSGLIAAVSHRHLTNIIS